MTWEWLDYTYVRSGIFSFLTIIAFYIFFRFLRISLDVLEEKITTWKGNKISDIKFQRVVFLSENQIVEILENLIFIVRWCGYVLLLLLCITITLGFFPDTEEIAKKTWDSVLDPVETAIIEILKYIPKLILIAIIVFFTRFVLKGIRFFFKEVERGSIHLRGFHQDWAIPTYQIIRFFVFIFAFIIILPNLPASDSESFKGVSLFIGILVSLGSTTAIGNVVAGIVLTYMRPFKVNDFITIENSTGLVVEKSLLMTRIMTQRKEEITIPNLKILSHTIINYSTNSKKEGVIFYTNVGVSYQHSWQTIANLLIEAARRTETVEKDPSPFVLQSRLSDFYASYELNAHTKNPELMIHVYSELRKNIIQVFAEHRIELATPIHYTLDRNNSNKEV